MRQAQVYCNGTLAGILSETANSTYIFKYDVAYLNDSSTTAISLTLPKTTEEYSSTHLFPFFFNMLSEGANRTSQCRSLKIDEDDDFGLLLAISHTDTIGSITLTAS